MSERPPARRSGRPPTSPRPASGRRSTRAPEGKDIAAPARRPDDPEIAEGVTWHDLDRQARAALRSLPKEMAERVGAHLAMAGMLIDDDPEEARRHTDVARRLAARVALVREAAALTAYACGDFDAALQELRAYRRLSGDQRHLPLMADCERGLGRPERALEIAASPEARSLPADVAAELRIVVAGARCDLGQPEAALALLGSDPRLGSAPGSADPGRTDPGSVRLRYAYADVLAQLGRREEAAEWFAAVAADDLQGITDAAERAAPGEEQAPTT